MLTTSRLDATDAADCRLHIQGRSLCLEWRRLHIQGRSLCPEWHRMHRDSKTIQLNSGGEATDLRSAVWKGSSGGINERYAQRNSKEQKMRDEGNRPFSGHVSVKCQMSNVNTSVEYLETRVPYVKDQLDQLDQLDHRWQRKSLHCCCVFNKGKYCEDFVSLSL